MRIAITGATGNVGTALIRVLAEQRPDDELIGFARRIPAKASPYDRMEWMSVDLGRNDSAETLVRGFDGVDAVVHLAIAFQPMRNREYLRQVKPSTIASDARSRLPKPPEPTSASRN